MTNDVVRAAGGVVWRRGDGGGVEILLVHRPRYDDWSLPKGKADPGETDEECALREVEEETGLTCELGPYLGEHSYRDQRDRPKVARFWAMRTTGGSFSPNREVDEVKWLPAADARGALTRSADADIVDDLAAHLPRPSLMLVVRHASAGERAAWTGDDRLRPLDERGQHQAEALVDQLSGYAVDRVLSSPFVRCVQSVEPLATALGLRVEETDRLAEEHGDEAVALVRELEGSTAVLCTHGDVVPVLLDALLPGQGHRTSKKGSTWAIEVAGTGSGTGQYLPPPA